MDAEQERKQRLLAYLERLLIEPYEGRIRQPTSSALPRTPCSSFCHDAEPCIVNGAGICEAIKVSTADQLIEWLERRNYGWSLDHTGRMIEARIWDWPNVIGRYRPATVEPLADMLRGAMRTMTREQLCKTNA